MIHYIGPGKKNTGDWCFADGFITFKDITDAYMECFQSKSLEITSDCSYSGRWVSNYRVFMDKVRVQPCLHSGREKNIILGVWASCPMKYHIHCCTQQQAGEMTRILELYIPNMTTTKWHHAKTPVQLTTPK